MSVLNNNKNGVETVRYMVTELPVGVIKVGRHKTLFWCMLLKSNINKNLTFCILDLATISSITSFPERCFAVPFSLLVRNPPKCMSVVWSCGPSAEMFKLSIISTMK